MCEFRVFIPRPPFRTRRAGFLLKKTTVFGRSFSSGGQSPDRASFWDGALFPTNQAK
jgi:hypothetical protein